YDRVLQRDRSAAAGPLPGVARRPPLLRGLAMRGLAALRPCFRLGLYLHELQRPHETQLVGTGEGAVPMKPVRRIALPQPPARRSAVVSTGLGIPPQRRTDGPDSGSSICQPDAPVVRGGARSSRS